MQEPTEKELNRLIFEVCQLLSDKLRNRPMSLENTAAMLVGIECEYMNFILSSITSKETGLYSIHNGKDDVHPIKQVVGEYLNYKDKMSDFVKRELITKAFELAGE